MAIKKKAVIRFILGFSGVVLFFFACAVIFLIIALRNGSVVSKGSPISDYPVKKSALLVIDIQEATTGDVSMYPYFQEHADCLIRNINRAADTFQSRNLPVVYVRSVITNPLINLVNNSYAKGSPGVRLDKRLKIVSDLEVAKKGKDSFRNTILDSILTNHQVSNLYIVGLDAAECVKATVEAAQNRCYNITLLEDALLSKSQETKDSIIAIFKQQNVRVIRLDSLDTGN
jgi:nicotinamidase-related amidase